jgi:hypothetical protein
MEIKWPNLIFFALMIFTVVWAVRAQDSIFVFLSQLGNLGPEHSTDERYWSLLVFSLLVISIVALVRIFVDSRTHQ